MNAIKLQETLDMIEAVSDGYNPLEQVTINSVAADHLIFTDDDGQRWRATIDENNIVTIYEIFS